MKISKETAAVEKALDRVDNYQTIGYELAVHLHVSDNQRAVKNLRDLIIGYNNYCEQFTGEYND